MSSIKPLGPVGSLVTRRALFLSPRVVSGTSAPYLRGLSSAGSRAKSSTEKGHTHLLAPFGGVHGSKLESTWKNKPLFRISEEDGVDGRFRTGLEASEMLIAAARRMDPFKKTYLETAENVITTLAPVFDRWPKYAWVTKQLLSPERAFTFRVAWLDDKGIVRVNRGYRYQYSSSLGPFEGPLHFHADLTSDMIKAHAFDLVLSNALSGLKIGASVGGADFNGSDKSETEIQRFCQAYMAAVVRHIGPHVDLPSMGGHVGGPEIGYLYGQYKRLSMSASPVGEGFMWGGAPPHAECAGYGVVYFAEKAMRGKGDSLRGKRCLITGSGKVALYAAEKLLELGAIPVTMSDSSGHIYEPQGIDADKLKVMLKIKEERGARIGRYIVASKSAKYNEPESVLNVPCDVAFLCSQSNEVGETEAMRLVSGGCKAVIDGSYRPVTPEGSKVLRKNEVLHVPYRGSLVGAVLGSGRELGRNPLKEREIMDDRVEAQMSKVYEEASSISREFNARGDLEKGCTIAGFLRVARAMVTHGAV